MKKNGFTLVELLATIIILGIVLAIAVPSISGVIENSTRESFRIDAKEVLRAIDNERIENRKFDVLTINKDNIEDLLNITNANYSTVNVITIEDNIFITLVGINKWNGLIACGTYDDMNVVNEISDCSNDIVPPIITILGDDPVNIFIGEAYTDAGATALDDRDGDITSKIVVTGTINPSIPGSYTITYTVTDITGNQASSSRTVNVIDNVAPTITFNPNGNSIYAKSRITKVDVTDVGGINDDSLKYVWTTSSDEPSSDSFTNTYTNGQDIGTPSGVTGGYYLWVIAKDNSGNTTITRTNVFNLDNTAPIITLNGSNPVNINVGSTYSDAGATATDADSGVSGSVTSIGSVNPSVVGIYTITYNVSDNAGNVADLVTRTVNVVDVSAPVITINGSNPITINVGSTYTDAGATALDDVDGDVTSKIVTTGTVNPNVVGTYTITYTVKDNTNNTATATRTVNVIDNVAPTVAFGTNGNSTYAKSRSTTVTVSDNISINISSLKYLWNTSTTTPSEASFSSSFSNGGTITTPAGVTGSYYLWVLAKDNVGNTKIQRTNTFNLDNTKPVITLNGSSTVTINAEAAYSDAGATATDAHSGISGSVTATGAVNPSVAGTYTITYNVSDNAGNAATPITRTVNVIAVYNGPGYIASKGVNGPVLATGMTPIKWDGTTWVNTTTSDSDWYNYNTTDKKWANAKTADGSMWVWVPRYIYKISSGWHTSTPGTIEVQFSKGIDDNWNSSSIGNIDTGTTAESSNNKWTNHPAFDFGSIKLTGIWIAKFEATAAEGVANTPTGDNVTTKTVKISPNVKSWRDIQIGNIFTVSRNMETNSRYGWGTSGSGIDTHMMKNTEWGAVAYLSISAYGKNTEITANNNSSFYTGGGTSDAYVTRVNQSTTGNIYGIYDMSGGTSEYVAAYVNNDHVNLDQGSSITYAASQYKNVYTVGYPDDSTGNYTPAVNFKGDAVYETSGNGYGYSWFAEVACMPNTNSLWIARGGMWNTTPTNSGDGVFAFYGMDGKPSGGYGFRPVLAVNAGL